MLPPGGMPTGPSPVGLPSESHYGHDPFQTHQRQASPSYGNVGLPLSAKGRPTRSSLIFPAMLAFCVVVFLVTVTTFFFGLFYHANVVALLVLAGFAGCVTAVVKRDKGPALMPLGVCAAASLLVGIIVGVYIYETYGYFVHLYTNARVYNNVLPAEPAAAVGDAGRVVFAKEARLDFAKATGFAASDGRQYCVAPVRGLLEEKQYSFWAVGVDCCSKSSSFTCDDAKNPKARAGIVLFDNNGFFRSSRKDRFDLARRKAAGTFGLDPNERAMYIQWVTVDKLQRLTQVYHQKAAIFVLVSTGLFTALFAPFVRVMCAPIIRSSTWV